MRSRKKSKDTTSVTRKVDVVLWSLAAQRAGINTMTQFLDHLTNDAMPALIDRLSSKINRG